MVGLSKKRVFPKTKGDSITGQDRAQKHCDFRFSQIEKKSKVAVLQLGGSLCELTLNVFSARSVSASDMQSYQIAAPQINALATTRIQGIIPVKRGLFCQYGLPI